MKEIGIIFKNLVTFKVEIKNYLDRYIEIPRNPGLYIIQTTAAKEILSDHHERKDKAHYNLKKKIAEASLLPKDILIHQHKREPYVVYSGHSQCLRQRFIEHFRGSKGTGCLALFQLEGLEKYDWWFNYIDLSSINFYQDSKLYRTYLEHHYRIHNGWPILCSQ